MAPLVTASTNLWAHSQRFGHRRSYGHVRPGFFERSQHRGCPGASGRATLSRFRRDQCFLRQFQNEIHQRCRAAAAAYFAAFQRCRQRFSGADLGADWRRGAGQHSGWEFPPPAARSSVLRIPWICSLNTDYTVVTRLVNSNSVSTLWINPTAETDAGVSTSEGAFNYYHDQLCFSGR